MKVMAFEDFQIQFASEFPDCEYTLSMWEEDRFPGTLFVRLQKPGQGLHSSIPKSIRELSGDSRAFHNMIEVLLEHLEKGESDERKS